MYIFLTSAKNASRTLGLSAPLELAAIISGFDGSKVDPGFSLGAHARNLSAALNDIMGGALVRARSRLYQYATFLMVGRTRAECAVCHDL